MSIDNISNLICPDKDYEEVSTLWKPVKWISETIQSIVVRCFYTQTKLEKLDEAAVRSLSQRTLERMSDKQFNAFDHGKLSKAQTQHLSDKRKVKLKASAKVTHHLSLGTLLKQTKLEADKLSSRQLVALIPHAIDKNMKIQKVFENLSNENYARIMTKAVELKGCLKEEAFKEIEGFLQGKEPTNFKDHLVGLEADKSETHRIWNAFLTLGLYQKEIMDQITVETPKYPVLDAHRKLKEFKDEDLEMIYQTLPYSQFEAKKGFKELTEAQKKGLITLAANKEGEGVAENLKGILSQGECNDHLPFVDGPKELAFLLKCRQELSVAGAEDNEHYAKLELTAVDQRWVQNALVQQTKDMDKIDAKMFEQEKLPLDRSSVPFQDQFWNKATDKREQLLELYQDAKTFENYLKQGLHGKEVVKAALQDDAMVESLKANALLLPKFLDRYSTYFPAIQARLDKLEDAMKAGTDLNIWEAILTYADKKGDTTHPLFTAFTTTETVTKDKYPHAYAAQQKGNDIVHLLNHFPIAANDQQVAEDLAPAQWKQLLEAKKYHEHAKNMLAKKRGVFEAFKSIDFSGEAVALVIERFGKNEWVKEAFSQKSVEAYIQHETDPKRLVKFLIKQNTVHGWDFAWKNNKDLVVNEMLANQRAALFEVATYFKDKETVAKILEEGDVLKSIQGVMTKNAKGTTALLVHVLQKALTELIPERDEAASNVFNAYYTKGKVDAFHFITELKKYDLGTFKRSLTSEEQRAKDALVVQAKHCIAFWERELAHYDNVELRKKIAELKEKSK